jgi:Family of unknown function (DUF5786)
MSIGRFDAEEYERREKRLRRIRTDSDDQRPTFKGHLEYIGDESVDELLAQWATLKDTQQSNR